jgi:hypothetical protein
MSYLTEGDSVESSNCLTHRIHSTGGADSIASGRTSSSPSSSKTVRGDEPWTGDVAPHAAGHVPHSRHPRRACYLSLGADRKQALDMSAMVTGLGQVGARMPNDRRHRCSWLCG